MSAHGLCTTGVPASRLLMPRARCHKSGTRRLTVSLVAACVIAVVLAIVPSHSEAARWDIVTMVSPTTLVPNSPRNEVQQLTVEATGGAFAIKVLSINGVCNEGSSTVPIPFNATAAAVQSALEALPTCIGPGAVTVTGGPGGGAPYVVTFVGGLGDRPMPILETDSSQLTGGAATATITEVTHGEFMPYLLVKATNIGGTATDGSTINLADTLPASLTATSVSGFDAYASSFASEGFGGAEMSCSALPALSCSYAGVVAPGDILIMRINLQVPKESLAPEEIDDVQVSGGGAVGASASTPVVTGDIPAPFGPAPGTVRAALSTSQAGAHGNMTTAFALTTNEPSGVPAEVKDVRFDLPPGLVGSTVGMAQCTMSKILNLVFEPKGCPSDTMVGMAIITITNGAPGEADLVVPMYNIAPASGEPAAFAFSAANLPVRLDTSLLSNGDYGVRVTAADVRNDSTSLAASVTTWGVPADHSGPGEDRSYYDLFDGGSFGGSNPGQTRVPLLSNPQQCSEPLFAALSTDSWPNPGAFVSAGPVAMGTLTGCDQLSLESSFTMLPDTLEAGAPAGYSFGLKIPQRNEPNSLVTPNVKNAKLTMPAGVVANPSAAWGLKACSDAQFFGPNKGKQEPATLAECPHEAQIGKVRVKSPSLEEALEGEVYLAEPECHPCTPEDARDGKMIRLFLQVVSEGEGGIVVKLSGRGSIDQQTGQITTTFENNPQLPFESLKLDLNGGPRATLANPRTCGSVRSNLDLTPWSTPFTSDSTPFYDLEVNRGCFGPQFNPSFVAGVTNLQAGAYGPFTLSFGRSDQDQFLGGLEMKMPPGLLGKLSSVTRCKEPQASEGTCGPESLIGHAQALAGPGADPYLVSGGQVFLTESYKGAPFGLSIVEPAVAGPYTLAGTTGHGTVVVRAKIEVDPHTAQVIVKSDPLPTILDGIPLQLRVVNATIDRNEFTFGPTNCSKLQVTGTLSSSEGMNTAVSSPFQVANCANLPFKPSFKVSTQAKTSKAAGASLSVKVGSGAGQANIGKVRIVFPKQLPARLTTLQKACTDTVFNSNPSACPTASVIGTAIGHTPVLTNPLIGPVYLVSHGGVAFPDAVIVLQGEGVTLYLDGNTNIKKGITSSTFNSVPDAPITSFEVKLPEGPHSAFATNIPAKAKGSMCGQSLKMPTVLTGQNGAALTQTTKIAVTGCPKKKAKKAKKTSSTHHGKGKATKKK